MQDVFALVRRSSSTACAIVLLNGCAQSPVSAPQVPVYNLSISTDIVDHRFDEVLYPAQQFDSSGDKFPIVQAHIKPDAPRVRPRGICFSPELAQRLMPDILMSATLHESPYYKPVDDIVSSLGGAKQSSRLIYLQLSAPPEAVGY